MPGIDPSIVFNLKAPQVADPLQQAGQALNLIGGVQRVRAGQQEMESQGLQLEQQRQDVADNQELRRLASEHGPDFDKILAGAAGKVSPKRLAELATAVAQQKSQMSAATRDDLANQKSRNDLVTNLSGVLVGLPPEQQAVQYPQAVAKLVELGLVKPGELPPQYPGPEAVQRFHDSHAGWDKVLDHNLKLKGDVRADAEELRKAEAANQAAITAGAALPGVQADSELKVARAAGKEPTQPAEQARLDAQKIEHEDTVRHQKAMERLTGEGHLMTDRRARELADLTREAAKDAREGKPPTAAQSTVATYAARIDKANSDLSRLVQGGFERGYNKAVPNALQTEKGQAFDRAERDFINAVLRRESGAVISPSEFSEARKQYIPQINDGETVLKDKADARKIVFEGFKRAAGKAFASADELLGAPASGGKNGDPLGIR